MSCEMEPETLGFNHPLNRSIERTLWVHNTSSAPLAFKVKTTASKRYAVRPNYGRIEPRKAREISIRMIPYAEDLPPGSVCKDKFLIETTVVKPEEKGDLVEELWSAAKESPGTREVQARKIRVVYLPREDRWFGESLVRRCLEMIRHARSTPPDPEHVAPRFGALKVVKRIIFRVRSTST
ncbi:PapD-like protein [Calocera viscosa TUFC12733]|uniref:PapD-like protein n=1 Tax=Calocera viscosa (strain TUFC12733) TaxID=1330018 RepID=A0A167RUJ4_CALVF|nr:PapD-like protein [Calocera viscosa TUFC12733]